MPEPYDRMTEEPGGMECEECNVAFVGAEYHRICAVCAGINPPPPQIAWLKENVTPEEMLEFLAGKRK